jgi:hypothetical protein
MLTLFVVPSGKPNADFAKTVESFRKSGVKFKAVKIDCWREINALKNKDDWFCVFWDNEGLDVNLQKALKVHLSNRNAEVLVLYKRLDEKTAEYRTRFMKRGVWLTEDFKPIAPWIIHETILDGWVKEHAINDKH